MSGSRAGNGRSSIYKDDKGVWNGWVSMGRDASGKAVRRHVRGKTATDVADKVAQLEAQRNGSAGRTAVAGKTTVGEWLDEWLRIMLRIRAPRTYESYPWCAFPVTERKSTKWRQTVQAGLSP